MARFYITEGIIKYSVNVVKMNTNSNYDTSIRIHMVGEKFPVWGTVVKSSDNARKLAKEVIKSWAKK